MNDLHELGVLVVLNPVYLFLYFLVQTRQSVDDIWVVSVSVAVSVAVGIETYVYPLARETTHQVVVAVLFVGGIIRTMLVLVGFNRQHRPPNQLAVVYPSSQRAVAMCRLQRLVVQEPIEILVDVVSHNVFLAFCADLFDERVVREEVDETVGAVVSVVWVVSCWTRDTVFIRGTPFVLDIHHVVCCVCLAVQCLCLAVDIVVWAFFASKM